MNIRRAALLIPLMVLCTTMVPAALALPGTISGEVLEIQDDLGFDQLTILTLGGESMRVHLGEAGSCRGLVAAGDQVRICLMDGMLASGARQAMSMKVRRTGASYMFRNGAGQMNKQWARSRARDGSCGRIPGERCPSNPQCPGGGIGGGMGGGPSGGGGGGGQRGGGR